MVVTEQISQWIRISAADFGGYGPRIFAKIRSAKRISAFFLSARSAADISRYLPWVVDFHLIGNFSTWQSYLQSIPVLLAQELKLHIMSTQQRKRLRKYSVSSLSDITEQCDEEVEEITEFPNSSDNEPTEEIEEV